ncbi:putative nepenthesin [Lupinus albus]|uniref:Putative nepenthesin n=1 Tax=Lupinus albus TaxID=3870 RepID=A0A6A4PVA8_LUPAL|nr:putative nepenthesin [Lupinus albus]
MSPYHYVLVVLSITLSTTFKGDMYLTEALNGGFSIELIHRDSPKSPFYNSSEIQIERTTNAIHCSFERSNTSWQLLTRVVALFWVQCQPCKKCYNQTNLIFDPSKSKTYKASNCCSQACKLIKESGCKKTSLCLKCQYKKTYEDESFSYGDVAQETFSFDTNVKNSPTRFEKIIFGCGIVGLGNGVTSLTSQLGSITDNKFSYCLSQEPNIPSLLNFGEKVAVSSIGTISTPLEYVPSSSHYHLSLNGMTVAGKRLNFFNPVIGNAGNIILDLGTTLTFLPTYFYTKLESLVATQINLRPFPFKELLPKGQKLCYKSPPSAFKAPPITVHFAGANIVLNTLNTFGLYDGLMCFTFNLDDKVSIFGSIAQTNFPVGIDRQKKVVFFKPTDCTKLQS